jgi:hypothetical protein
MNQTYSTLALFIFLALSSFRFATRTTVDNIQLTLSRCLVDHTSKGKKLAEIVFSPFQENKQASD